MNEHWNQDEEVVLWLQAQPQCWQRDILLAYLEDQGYGTAGSV